MSTPLLVRHPAPYPTESLVGYVLRLAEENGYTSPWSVYNLASLKQNEIRTTGFKLEKLEPVINFIPLKSKKYPSIPSSQTMGVWETEGRAGIRAM
jgi:hypothetical protein